ncbi:hypothetical protein [Siminovitchia terrae]|uniref:hypothetical protein n=1 Tax=Siminovitchia terrae TaxID=1914933 RepID=UPI0028A8920F|nr:hypothetical protein [Siminovitchia terrae]
MLRCMKTLFRASKETIDRLFECNRVSGEVWNFCLALAKEPHLKTGKWITKSELQKRSKGIFPIHSQSVQAVCHKYLFARDAALKARKAGHKTKYPYKKKTYFNTKWANNGFKVFENGKIELSMGIFEGRRQKPLNIWVKELPKGKAIRHNHVLVVRRKVVLAVIPITVIFTGYRISSQKRLRGNQGT